MSLLWAVPPIAVAVAVVLVLTQLRHLSTATVALREELRRVDEVRLAVVEVRTASAEARATVRRLRGA
jgi:cytochrome c-type biogenesis protein CcmH/NrfF